MRIYIDKIDEVRSEIENHLAKNYEKNMYFERASRKSVNYNGHKYYKVAEIVRQEKGWLGFFMILGSTLLSVLTLGAATFSKNITMAMEGKRFKSIYINKNIEDRIDKEMDSLFNSREQI